MTTSTIADIEHVLVIGAGAMGRQIAMTAALAGCRVTVQDVSDAMLPAAEKELVAWAEGRVGKGKLQRFSADAALGRLSWSTDVEEAAGTADFVIEAATERLDVKTSVFEILGRCTPEHAILTTNSSTYGSSKVADVTGRPEKVCNMHFFNPALVMKCVEVVRHERTSQATVDTTMDLARRLGKQPVLLHREVPGFVANRLMGAVQREALALADSGTATMADIDTAARTALGHPLGPFELMDLVGLDVIDFIGQATYAETGSESDRPDPTVARLVSQGRLGRKSGAGFYDYAASPGDADR